MPERDRTLIVDDNTEDRQAQREKQAVLDALHARDRAIAAAPNCIVITDPRQPDDPLVYVNEAFLRITGYAEEEVLGRNCRFLQGPDTDPTAVRELREAVRQEHPCQVTLLNYRKDGTTFFNKVTVSPVRDARGTLTHFVGIQSDVTVKHEANSERNRAEEKLRRSQEDLRLAIESAHLGTFHCDFPLDRIVCNNTCKGHFFLPPDADVDFTQFYELLHPEDREPTRQAIERALAERVEYDVEYRTLAANGRTRWINAVGRFHYDAEGSPLRFDGITLDITERKHHEVRERARLEDIFMRAPAFMATLRGPQHVFEMVNPPYYQLVGHRDILGKPLAVAMPEVVEQGFIGILDHVYQSGEPFTGKDVRILLQVTPCDPLEERFVDFAYQPLYGEDGEVTGILAHGIDLTGRKRLEIEQERLLGEARARAEREALLNRIGQTLRASNDPDAIQGGAVALLGQALGADRCHFAFYDIAAGTVTVTRDWHREGLLSNQGVYTFPNTAEMFRELHPDLNPSIIEDVHTATTSEQTRANMERLGLRSRLSVALMDNQEIMATLTASMADRPRVWTAEEVELVEAVAPPLRLAVELANFAQREHQIAEQLQRALQPPLPETVAGIKVTKYYEAALTEEAGVGGDFFDVFAIKEGCTALIVGDLSGKGLQAAASVSIVRNMLRAFLYSRHTVVDAVTELNRVLAENNLLEGFATLFVGTFDDGTRTLKFVNCGQEPALVRRAATEQVEELTATGPILGCFQDGAFKERAVVLARGDALAVFSDGLTECGPNRQSMLGVEGVSALFGQPVPEEEALEASELAERLALGLISGVDTAAAGGVMRDDVCLLVAVVE